MAIDNSSPDLFRRWTHLQKTPMEFRPEFYVIHLQSKSLKSVLNHFKIHHLPFVALFCHMQYFRQLGMLSLKKQKKQCIILRTLAVTFLYISLILQNIKSVQLFPLQLFKFTMQQSHPKMFYYLLCLFLQPKNYMRFLVDDKTLSWAMWGETEKVNFF